MFAFESQGSRQSSGFAGVREQISQMLQLQPQLCSILELHLHRGSERPIRKFVRRINRKNHGKRSVAVPEIQLCTRWKI